MAPMPDRKLAVEMVEILDAMTRANEDPFEYWLDLTEGRVVVLGDELVDGVDYGPIARAMEEEPDRYAEIPRFEAREEYGLMCRFAEQVDESDIREMLDLALRGKGAFGRFRDVVFRYPDLQAGWFALRQEALLEAVRVWFAELGIEPLFDLKPIERPPSDHAPRSAPPSSVELFDLLLLGAPDGKTELIDGRVLRQMSTKSPSQARSIFKALARGLCHYYGLEWRNRYIKGKSAFDLERAHLRIDGTRIELGIEVSVSTWQAFE